MIVELLLLLGCKDQSPADDTGPAPCGAIAWYPDADLDSFGDASATPIVQCDPPDGAVADATDCDDTQQSTYPGAAELCDGVDNDCDTFADDGLEMFEVWFDADGDGFGDDARPSIWCEASGTLVAASGDCDDGDPDVYPTAHERLGDGIDNDCDGEIDAERAPLRVADCLSLSPYAGCSLAALADWSGGGAPELAVGSPGEGAVLVLSGEDLSFYARMDGSPSYGAAVLGLEDGLLASAPAADATLAELVWTAADGSQLGYADLPDGTFHFAHRLWPAPVGFVFSFQTSYNQTLAGAAMLVREFQDESDFENEDNIGIFPMNDPLVWSNQVVVADFDGSGTDDIIVSDSGVNSAGGALSVGVDPEPPAIVPSWQPLLISGEPLSEFGTSMAAIPDIDGDGLPELLVGAPALDEGAGAAYIFTWTELQLSAASDAYVIIAGRGGLGATVTSLGDFNGDAMPDLALAAPSSDSVMLYGASPGQPRVWRSFGAVYGDTGSDFGRYMVPLSSGYGPALIVGAPGVGGTFAAFGVAE